MGGLRCQARGDLLVGFPIAFGRSERDLGFLKIAPLAAWSEPSRFEMTFFVYLVDLCLRREERAQVPGQFEHCHDECFRTVG